MDKKRDEVVNDQLERDSYDGLFTEDLKLELVQGDGKVSVALNCQGAEGFQRAIEQVLAKPSNSQARTVPMDKTEVDRIVAEGERWLAANRQIVESLPPRTVVAVNVDNAQYVTGASGLDAMERFAAMFGSEARAWIHRVGGPISLGSGLWALKSGA